LRDNVVRYRAALLMGGLALVMAPLGVAAAQRIPNTPLTIAFAAVLALSAWRCCCSCAGSAGSRFARTLFSASPGSRSTLAR
jgi:uncharacterized membrane protein YfcA